MGVIDDRAPEYGFHSSVASRADKNGICLCKVEDLPVWHFSHRGIKHGYRYCKSIKSARRSLFYWHNETINIWTHVLAGAVVLLVFLLKIPYVMSLNGVTLIDKIIIITMTVFGHILPLLASATCHLLYCTNKRTHKLCWYGDYIGMLLTLVLSDVGHVYFSLYCYSKYVVWSLILVLVIFCLFAANWCWVNFSRRLSEKELIPKDRFPEFSRSLKSLAVVGSLPVLYTWLCQPEYLADDALFDILIRSTSAPVLMAISVVVFAQGGVPERFFPNKNYFDYIGHSHNFWHICSGSIIVICNIALLDHCVLRSTRQCAVRL